MNGEFFFLEIQSKGLCLRSGNWEEVIVLCSWRAVKIGSFTSWLTKELNGVGAVVLELTTFSQRLHLSNGQSNNGYEHVGMQKGANFTIVYSILLSGLNSLS